MKEDNKDVLVLKEEIWMRRQIKAEVIFIWKN